MLVTGLAGLGTWYAYRDEQWVLTGLAGLGTLGLYIRQIGGGVTAVEQFNDGEMTAWRDDRMFPNLMRISLHERDSETLELEVQVENED